MVQILLHPSLAAFEAERARATLGRAITHTFAVGIILGTLHGCVNWLGARGVAAEIVTTAVMTALQLVAALIVAQAFLFVAERAMGGRGDFATQAYLSALAFAPLYGSASLADIAPSFGAIAAIAAMLWCAILVALALRVAHGDNAWRVSNVGLFAVSCLGGMIAWWVMLSLPS